MDRGGCGYNPKGCKESDITAHSTEREGAEEGATEEYTWRSRLGDMGSHEHFAGGPWLKWKTSVVRELEGEKGTSEPEILGCRNL